MARLLKVRGLKVAYGGIQAVKGVDFEVHEGELVSLIGANGAGKTTTLKAITGLQPVAGGEIEYLGAVDPSARGPGSWSAGPGDGARRPRRVRAHDDHREPADGRVHARRQGGIAADVDTVFAIFPRLKERARQLAGTMSGGEQQMLAMGRALMARPKVLLLDEPSMGLSPIMVDKIFEVMADIHSRRVSPRAARRAERQPRAGNWPTAAT
jgi:branched-chain amino acid transport system ATP-binding protein